MGYPVILGYEDTSFLVGKKRYVLQLDFSNEDNFAQNIKLIDEFVKLNHDQVVAREDISFIDIETIELRKLIFMQEVVLGAQK